MIKKSLLMMLLCLSFGSLVAQAQDIQTKGSISATVMDINGAVVQNAGVTVHPVYLSPGEIPVGGRGKLGRTPFFAQLDLHADYPWQISERIKLSFIADFFNVTNNRRVRLPNQFRESTAGQLNPDFLQPQLFHLPFNMRLGARLEW